MYIYIKNIKIKLTHFVITFLCIHIRNISRKVRKIRTYGQFHSFFFSIIIKQEAIIQGKQNSFELEIKQKYNKFCLSYKIDDSL